MNYFDKERLARLTQRVNTNYRLTRLYAAYLENCPELINAAMMDELTRDGDIEEETALRALVAEILGLDDARGGEDRRLVREYLPRSVRLLDTKKYTENPYYKNIKLNNVKDGDWELREETYPPYRAFVAGDMVLEDDGTEYAPLGFFKEEFRFPAVLEGGNEWMTLTPVDVDTCDEAIAAAHGRVVTFGLGLGYYAYRASEKSEVESVTVVELSESVTRLFKRHLLPQFAHPEKIRIVNADAFDYAARELGREGYDVAFVDIWRDASDGAPAFIKMKRLEHLAPKTQFFYWIEGFIVSHLRAQRFDRLLKAVEDGDAAAPESFSAFIEELEAPFKSEE